MLTTFVLMIISILLCFIILIWNFDYWKKRGVTSPSPLPNIVNYIKALTNKRYMLKYLDNIYSMYKNDEDFVGIYNLRTPQLLILNPKLCQQIYEQNFNHFHDNEISTILDEESKTFFGNNPFMLTGDEWQQARSLLKAGLENQMFKTDFNTLAACRKMKLNIEESKKMCPNEGVNVGELCLSFTSEVVSDCIFGFRFCGQPTTKFITTVISSTFQRNFNVSFYLLTTSLMPTLKKIYKTRLLPQRIAILFEKLMQTAVDLRKSQTAPTERQDFLNHLLDLQKRKNLTTLDLTTFTTAFMLHGLPTIATVLTHCIVLLAKHQSIQERLRSEIFQKLDKNKEVFSEIINELPYLDACILETIRIVAPTYYASKVCTEPMQLISKTGRSINLKKGEIVFLPVYSIMNDDNLYINAKEFRPERFLGPTGLVTDDYLQKGLFYGFGAGPRKCIGEQFALTRIKAAIVSILSSFQVEDHAKAKKVDTTNKYDYNSLKNGDVWLNFEAVNLSNQNL